MEHTVETTAEPGAVWSRWLEVAAWPAWDESLETARLEGPWLAGSRVVLQRRGGCQEGFALEDIQEGRSFVLSRKHWLVRMRWHFQVEPARLGSRVTQRLEVEGPVAWWLELVEARRIRSALPSAVRKLARLAAQD